MSYFSLNANPILVVECGTDEAGQGCLAGPITAAAVILPPPIHMLYHRFQKLTVKQRTELRKEIERLLYYGIAHVLPDRIDE